MKQKFPGLTMDDANNLLERSIESYKTGLNAVPHVVESVSILSDAGYNQNEVYGITSRKLSKYGIKDAVFKNEVENSIKTAKTDGLNLPYISVDEYIDLAKDMLEKVEVKPYGVLSFFNK